MEERPAAELLTLLGGPDLEPERRSRWLKRNVARSGVALGDGGGGWLLGALCGRRRRGLGRFRRRALWGASCAGRARST